MNLPVEIRLKNCFGMSFRGRMTQERFLVSPRFLSISVDVDPFIKKCWLAVVLQSLLFRSCRRIDDSSVCWIPRLSSRRRSFFRTIATPGWFWPVDWHQKKHCGLTTLRTYVQNKMIRLLHRTQYKLYDFFSIFKHWSQPNSIMPV